MSPTVALVATGGTSPAAIEEAKSERASCSERNLVQFKCFCCGGGRAKWRGRDLESGSGSGRGRVEAGPEVGRAGHQSQTKKCKLCRGRWRQIGRRLRFDQRRAEAIIVCVSIIGLIIRFPKGEALPLTQKCWLSTTALEESERKGERERGRWGDCDGVGGGCAQIECFEAEMKDS